MELRTSADLRSVYLMPKQGPIDKVIHRLDQHCVDFLARSPFFVLSSANDHGVCDGSPKGGQPGFVRVLDEHRLAWADFAGNNRLDSFENIVTNPSVALLFFIPGLDETLRVNGRAQLHTGSDLCSQFAIDGRSARVVVVVSVEEAYIHCAKSFRRAGLWSPDKWPAPDALPNIACVVKDHARLEFDTEVIEAARERDLQETLWKPGGVARDS
ncbi:MAG TPA: MSMEG_1061 family FMN-dependent PPOX-type flavoprotein [Acidimicrobiia bacterium]|nr:MSMEG_1061 family FMN-dependent PPOX-type flavoprotein [Acidimicrobiia bacterium]